MHTSISGLRFDRHGIRHAGKRLGCAIEAEGNQLSSKLLEHAERLEWAEQLGISSDVDVESAGLRY